MSFVTIEVDIDHGRVIPRGAELLPEKGCGLLTLLPDNGEASNRSSIKDFIGKWAGAFSLSESSGDDPRFEYLLGKHVR